MKTITALAAAFTLAAIAPSAASAQPPGPQDPSLAGFPPGYIQDCATRPRTVALVVPAPLNAYMRVICTRVSDALAPPPGYEWVFPDNMVEIIPALKPNVAPTDDPAHFTRLVSAPLTAAELAAFRQRLAGVVKNPEILKAEVMRLEVDTSTGDHKQEYLLVSHTPGASPSAWGLECYNDCNPMEKTPWAWVVAKK
jgi:hypothetical protein